MSDGLDILAVGAHPDDVEVHVGGLLALAAEKGLRTGILDLTAGDLGTRGTAETRRLEAQRAAEILGAARVVMGLPDGRFEVSEPNRVAVIAQVRALRPRLVILPPATDRHPDHSRAHQLVKEACFYAGLRQYPADGAPHRPEALAWVGGENPGVPDLVVDVSTVWERRMAAFDAFGSQFSTDADQPVTRISHPAFRRGIEGRAMHWGSLISVAWAEALWCERPVPPALLAILGRLGE